MLVSWRKLAQEPENCTYNMYRRGQGSTEYTKVNSTPISLTNYQVSKTQVPSGSELAVTMVSPDGTESEKSKPFLFNEHEWSNVFLDIDFETKILNPNDYRVVFARPLDLDGNGEYDAVLVDRMCANSDKQPTATDPNTNTKLQMYTFDGECLWTLDAGPNQSYDEGQNDKIVVYDINCDGKCEVIVKSTDGTRFWDSKNNTWGKYANGKSDPDTDGDGIVDYTKQDKRNPPFYISILDARTGEEIVCNELDYSAINDGQDAYSRDNRADYYDDNEGKEYAFLTAKFAICYFDGIHPSLAVQCYNRNKKTGHHYYVCEWKFDWAGGKPTNWHHAYTWSMRNTSPAAAEFHQFRVCDVDGDGIDEVMEGGYAVNSTKGMVMSPGIGHGDRFDVSDIDPDRPGLEIFMVHEETSSAYPWDAEFRDAMTGEVIWGLRQTGNDIGRGLCADMDSTKRGAECWPIADYTSGTKTNSVFDCKGNQISTKRPSVNFRIYWMGNLYEQVLEKGVIDKWRCTTAGGSDEIIDFTAKYGCGLNLIKDVPALQADILGDWREEVIYYDAATKSNLMIFPTTYPTNYRIPCLMHDHTYRMAICWQNVAYNQPPHVGYYLPDYGNYVAERLKDNGTASNLSIQTNSDMQVVCTQTGSGLLIRLDGTQEAALSLFSSAGSLLWRTNAVSGNGKSICFHHWNMLPAGAYILKAAGNDKTVIHKLIK